jgi:hypothetical protein
MLQHLRLLLQVCRHHRQWLEELSREPEQPVREQWIEQVALAAWPELRTEVPWRLARARFPL